MKMWILGLGAVLGAAALIVAALVPAAEAAMWPGLVVLCGVTGMALTRRVLAPVPETIESAAPPVQDVAESVPAPDTSREEMLGALLDRSPPMRPMAMGG